MIYKLGVSGASGRVGSEIAEMTRTGYEVGKDSFELTDAVSDEENIVSMEGVAARTFDTPPSEKVHVWIDFSQPEGTMSLIKEADCSLVIGTTGFSAKQQEQIKDYAKKYPVLLAPNMSPGMNLMMALLGKIPQKEKLGFSLVLSEEHHRFKKDSPSGTAKRLLEILKAKGYEDIPVHVTRAGGIKGTHSVKLISDYEEVEIFHRANDRRVFAEGALLGAAFLVKRQKAGLYSMEDVFFSEE